MSEKKPPEYTTTKESGKFWVNSPHNCLGRFGPNGWEIYRDVKEPTEVIGTPATLVVRVHPTVPLDWRNFVTLMKQHHGIDLSGEECPIVQG